jgi:hypothetical protein
MGEDLIESGRQDLNLRPLAPQAQCRGALPKAKRGKTPEKSSVFTLATIAIDYSVLLRIFKRFRQNG